MLVKYKESHIKQLINYFGKEFFENMFSNIFLFLYQVKLFLEKITRWFVTPFNEAKFDKRHKENSFSVSFLCIWHVLWGLPNAYFPIFKKKIRIVLLLVELGNNLKLATTQRIQSLSSHTFWFCFKPVRDINYWH